MCSGKGKSSDQNKKAHREFLRDRPDISPLSQWWQTHRAEARPQDEGSLVLSGVAGMALCNPGLNAMEAI
jgi:hypothetical protein